MTVPPALLLYEIPEPRTACYACGMPGSRYVEKYTAGRRARRICRSCYDAAVKREQAASAVLPGTIDVSRFVRVPADVGKCSVCGVARAEWMDPDGVKVCERCYGRGVREKPKESGAEN
ncbi:MAG: hypothetical protein WC586_06470 [Methanoregula sp.]